MWYSETFSAQPDIPLRRIYPFQTFERIESLRWQRRCSTLPEGCPGGARGPLITSTTFYQHQSTLRLMLRALGVFNYPGAAASAPDMDEFFTTPLP
jgi:hypothetical protein